MLLALKSYGKPVILATDSIHAARHVQPDGRESMHLLGSPFGNHPGEWAGPMGTSRCTLAEPEQLNFTIPRIKRVVQIRRYGLSPIPYFGARRRKNGRGRDKAVTSCQHDYIGKECSRRLRAMDIYHNTRMCILCLRMDIALSGHASSGTTVTATTSSRERTDCET